MAVSAWAWYPMMVFVERGPGALCRHAWEVSGRGKETGSQQQVLQLTWDHGSYAQSPLPWFQPQ